MTWSLEVVHTDKIVFFPYGVMNTDHIRWVAFHSERKDSAQLELSLKTFLPVWPAQDS